MEEIWNKPMVEGEYGNDSTLYKGKLFNSDTDAYNFYCLFAKTSAFSVRRGHSYKRINNNIEDIYKRKFICHRAGVAKQRKITEVENQRKRKSSRCNCSAKLLISKRTFGFEEKWMVTCFENSHNHALLDEKEIRFLPAYRDIPINDQARILLLSKVGCSVSLIMRVLEAEKGIEAGHLPFLDKDIRNFIKSQSSIDKENDASGVLKLCKDLKDKDDAFQYDFTLDESNKLEHIIWVFGDSMRAYEAFGDVVVFDTTYRINRYDMPLGLWVGVDNHGSSIFFGCSFVRIVKGKYPQTILTDQDHALKEAVSTELPNTKHAFCIWHIATKLPTWFSFVLGTKYDDFKTEFYRLYNLECESDFEQQWDLMVDRFHVTYLKEFFFAGMTTTGRSESINSYIKRFLDVGVAVNIRNQVGEEARMRQKYHNPLMKTSFPIEEHAASILTPYAFELLQHEIELSTKYAATVINNDSYLVRHHTKLDGGRSVTWIKEKNSIRCSCKQFEFSGILCRHAIRVLLKNDYFSIPEEYLLSRWRRESSLIPQSRHMINYNDNSSIEFRSLVQCLEVESLKTKDRVEVATKELKKVIHYLKGSRAKGGVEAAKKSRHCHYPNCGGTDHDSRNCPIKRKKDSLLASQSSPNK
ncbi:protein FAR1-RELATED SEQUENCE 11-like [Vigna angularis]|uniref:protein FAR1-RELATED SEQUENCE 11-like n=1 Tax=Phaseolus angularis TaxID=3914 RepID=UPI0022B42EFB|nr:protein FAR1-RELATED SEQUENCE 11-like [Vigna angularis]